MFKKILYTTWLLLFIFCIVVCGRNSNIKNFIDTVEYRTFDIRQTIQANDPMHRASEDIVILAIDDASYEYILQNYGEWPMPRDLYVKVINYIEKQNPQSIIFDLMFVKSIKSTKNADDMLVKAVTLNKNIFLAMNLDNQPASLRIPPDIPEHLRKRVVSLTDNVDLSYQTFNNCRLILNGLLYSTSNIGMTNVLRSEDGILRKVPPFLRYHGKYYPQLAFTAG